MAHLQERRTHHRVPYQAMVEVFCDGDAVGTCHAVDISEGGVQLKALQLPISTSIKLFVLLPADQEARPQALLLDGMVVWRTIGKSGIQFFDLSATSHQALKQLLAS